MSLQASMGPATYQPNKNPRWVGMPPLDDRAFPVWLAGWGFTTEYAEDTEIERLVRTGLGDGFLATSG